VLLSFFNDGGMLQVYIFWQMQPSLQSSQLQNGRRFCQRWQRVTLQTLMSFMAGHVMS
jgi:hypothetical protein